MPGSTPEPTGAQWFALHTLSGKEGKVKQYIDRYKTIEELDDYILEVLLPTETVSEVKHGKKSTIVRKLIPGYVFIHMKLFDADGKVLNKPWYFVRETTGVIGFVGGGTNPPLIPDEEVVKITTRMEEGVERPKPKVEFEVGETVRVIDGPFLNFTGIVEDVKPDKAKLKVMVSIFGRVTPVELEFIQVEKTS